MTLIKIEEGKYIATDVPSYEDVLLLLLTDSSPVVHIELTNKEEGE